MLVHGVKHWFLNLAFLHKVDPSYNQNSWSNLCNTIFLSEPVQGSLGDSQMWPSVNIGFCFFAPKPTITILSSSTFCNFNSLSPQALGHLKNVALEGWNKKIWNVAFLHIIDPTKKWILRIFYFLPLFDLRQLRTLWSMQRMKGIHFSSKIHVYLINLRKCNA